MTRGQWLALVLLLTGLLAMTILVARSGLRAFAAAIARAEGYGVPGAIPTVRNNPGDLKLTGGVITTFATAAEGWAALYRQLTLIVDGRSAFYTLDMTIGQMARVWTATEQDAWGSNVVNYLRANGWPTVTLDTPLRAVLT